MNKKSFLKDNEARAIRDLKELLSRKFDLIEFRLFGSKVRGESDFESDIDVMIELAETNPDIEAQIDDIVYEINLKNDSFISTIIFSKKELEEGPMTESPIYKIIQKEGIPL